MSGDFSYWEYDKYHSLWDVCIIGSGINGISAGISILEKKPGTKVLVIDRWFIPLGASTRNAGFSCFGSPSEILDDITKMGEDAAISLVKKRWTGLQKLKSRLENSNVQYENFGGYEVFHENEFESIHAQLPYLNELANDVLGLEKVFVPISVPAGIKGFSNAVFNQYEGQLHPVLMMQHLTDTFLKLGGKIWTGLEITQVISDNDRIIFQSELSIPIEAKVGIITTNAFASELLPELDVKGARNHVLVTEPIPGLAWKGAFHFDKGFYYFRNIWDRILLGGARNKDFQHEYTTSFGQNQIVVAALEDFLYAHLTDAETKIDFRWSGIIAVGGEKLPIIKAVRPRLFVGVRCSGMGIALASLVGEELAELVLQHD